MIISRDRMLNSAVNFALGFFGHPLDGKYQQSITLESYDKHVSSSFLSDRESVVLTVSL